MRIKVVNKAEIANYPHQIQPLLSNKTPGGKTMDHEVACTLITSQSLVHQKSCVADNYQNSYYEIGVEHTRVQHAPYVFPGCYA